MRKSLSREPSFASQFTMTRESSNGFATNASIPVLSVKYGGNEHFLRNVGCNCDKPIRRMKLSVIQETVFGTCITTPHFDVRLLLVWERYKMSECEAFGCGASPLFGMSRSYRCCLASPSMIVCSL